MVGERDCGEGGDGGDDEVGVVGSVAVDLGEISSGDVDELGEAASLLELSLRHLDHHRSEEAERGLPNEGTKQNGALHVFVAQHD